MSARRRLWLGLVVAIGGCSAASFETWVDLHAEPVAVASASAPVVAPVMDATSAPPVAARPRPLPAPDPEAVARAREEAARRRFEAEYPWQGVAYHFLAQVHARPDARSAVIGYMRRGAQIRAESDGERGSGCAHGWHRVPGGGYVCRGNGFQLGEGPQTFDPSPVGPALNDALPYAYGWIARNEAPQYWRIPTREEEAAALAWMERQRASEEATAPTDESAPNPDLEAPPGLATATAEDVDDTNGAPSFVRMRMRRGFYVSLDRREDLDDGRSFYRTVRGAYVPADAIAEAAPPSVRGVVLGGRWSLPLGFVFRGGVRTLALDPARDALVLANPIDRATPLPLRDEVIARQGQTYRVSDRGIIVRQDAMRIAALRARPPEVPEGARWIHVHLAQQTLVAYEGERPVFATMISSGREGFATPSGVFRIQSKHVSTTMDDPNAGEEAYSIEDVPWTMYFDGSYALHGAFWHDRFGHPRSHGCVNLAPADARWIFTWSDPALPSGWHGISADRAHPGAFVVVD